MSLTYPIWIVSVSVSETLSRRLRGAYLLQSNETGCWNILHSLSEPLANLTKDQTGLDDEEYHASSSNGIIASKAALELDTDIQPNEKRYQGKYES